MITEAIRGAKKSAPMHGNLALAKLAAGDLAGAAMAARKAFTLSPPSYADAHRVLGLVHRQKGQLREALQELERAQALGLQSADLAVHIDAACAQIQEQSDALKRPPTEGSTDQTQIESIDP